MPSVSILKTDHVTPSLASNINNFQEKLPLSVLDLKWLHLTYTQPLFLYPNTSLDSFSSIVQSMKSSLSKMLTKFYPLAAKLNYLQDTGEVVIDCAECSVEFVEAEFTANIKRLGETDVHDTFTFMELVPEIDKSVLHIPFMAVKVTRFTGGGMALRLAIHHVVANYVGWNERGLCEGGCCVGAGADGFYITNLP